MPSEPPLDPKRGDEILGRMLRTPPQPKTKKGREPKAAPKDDKER